MKNNFLYTRPLSISHALAVASSLALGILLTAAPDTGRRLLCMFTSACAAAYGIPVILAFVMSKTEKRLTLQLLGGVCAAAFAIFALIQPMLLMDFLFTVLAALTLLISGAAFRQSLKLRVYGFAHWYALLACAGVCMAWALCIIFFPNLFGVLLPSACGVLLIIQAINSLLTLFFLHRCSREGLCGQTSEKFFPKKKKT